MVESMHMERLHSGTASPSHPSRPKRVTLLAIGVLSIAGLHLLRLVEAVWQWQFLSDLKDGLPLYLALTGLIWASAGLPLFWGLWRGYARAARFAPGYLLVFALYYWLDRIWIANRGISLANWRVPAALTVVGLIYTFWALRARASRKYFQE
jgi:hypothetical protein